MPLSPDVLIAAIVICLIAYAAFRENLRHKRRAFIHHERISAIQKGVDVPPLEIEERRSVWNVQRTLLLAGLVWISLGVTIIVTLSAVIGTPTALKEGVPPGLQWVGLAPILIGLSHLVVYAVGKRKDS